MLALNFERYINPVVHWLTPQIGRILPCLQSGKDWKGNPETTGHAKDQSFGFQGLQDFLPSAH